VTLADLTEKASKCPTCWDPAVLREVSQACVQRYAQWQVSEAVAKWRPSDIAVLRGAVKQYISALKQASQDIARSARSWRMSIQVYDFAAKVGLTEADLLKAGRLVAKAFGIDGFPEAILDCDPEYPEDTYIVLAVAAEGMKPAELANARARALAAICQSMPPTKWQYIRVVLD
jgi:hypothetical protein